MRLILEVMAISDVASPNPPFFAEIATSGSPVLILFGILPFRDKKTKAQKLVEVKMTKVTTKSALDTPVGRGSVYPPILTSGWTTKQALFQLFLFLGGNFSTVL